MCSTLCDDVSLGDAAILGDDVALGDAAILGDDVSLGDAAILGDDVSEKRLGDARMSSPSAGRAGRMGRAMLRILVLSIVCLSAVTLTPRAAMGKPDGGRSHLTRGLQLYRAQQFEAAIAEFEAGYAVLPKAAFLLNIAQAWRKLGHLARAREFFQKFVDATPPGDHARVQALSIMDRIDAQLREQEEKKPRVVSPPLEERPGVGTDGQERAQPEPRDGTARPDLIGEGKRSDGRKPGDTKDGAAPPVGVSPRSRTPGWVGVGLASAGLAAIVAGIGLTVDALAVDQRYANPADGAVYDAQLLRRRDLERDIGVACFAAGGALALTGSVLAALYLPRRARSLAFFPTLSGASLQLAVEGRF